MNLSHFRLLILLIAYVFAVHAPVQNTDFNRSYKLAWSDEFNYAGPPDSAKWNYDMGDGCPDLCGWGNNERQHYTDRPKNVRVEEGNLIIEARKESYKDREYTSARLVTRGNHAWKYGRFEIRAKLPSGRGTWPAIWMLPEDKAYGEWLKSGEIDIMEHVGYRPNRIYGAVHTDHFNYLNKREINYKHTLKDAEQSFHTYGIEWTPMKIIWFVDDTVFATFKNRNKTYKEWPFDKRFHLILNIAVGGSWAGREGIAEDIWPQQLLIDYIRVYQKANDLSSK